MAFEKLRQKPSRGDYLELFSLMRMGQPQYDGLVEYWAGIEAEGGIWHIGFAGDFMLRGVLPKVARIRSLAARPEVHHRLPGSPIQIWEREAVAGLALGELLRRALPQQTAEGVVNHSLETHSIDINFRPPKPVAVLHQPREYLLGEDSMLPGFDPQQKPPDLYGDGQLVLATRTPALPTAEFFARFAGESGDQTFDPSQRVTVYPRLLKSFVEPPAVALGLPHA
ncbi:MAG TPA: hypothetical protein VLF71_04195 [Candidatus Saccharimonadales bacterium]|nr:hypothetical protein [Candidatus Saccharimonadales bacterium]